jgi:hypothetical protein
MRGEAGRSARECTGEPNDSGGVQDHAVINFTARGKWGDLTGSLGLRGVIELTAEPDPTVLGNVLAAHDNTIAGNLVGTDATGTAAIANSGYPRCAKASCN